MKLKLAQGILLGVVMAVLNGQTLFARINEDVADAAAAAPKETGNTADESNPYSIITDRNVFRLLEPPPPAAPTNEVVVPTVKLTGLVRMAGHEPRAMFVSVVKDAKEQAVYYNLAEGEREGSLELVKILEEQEAAEVINAGNKMTVLLKDSKNTTPPAAAGVAGPAGPPGSVPPPQRLLYGSARMPGIAGGPPGSAPQQIPPPQTAPQTAPQVPPQGIAQAGEQSSGSVLVGGGAPAVAAPAPAMGNQNIPDAPSTTLPQRTIPRPMRAIPAN